VNSSDSVAAQYTYDPFGNVTASGQNIPYPYQYAGMALDQTGLYFDGRSYYSPALGRMLEGYGAPHAPGGGQGGNVSLPSSSGGGANTASYAANAAIGVGAGAAVVVAGAVAANAVWVGDITIAGAIGAAAGGPVGIIAVAVVAIVAAVLDFLGINLFGGGSRPTPPPWYYRFFHYVAAKLLGLLPCLAPNMYDSAAVEAAAIFASPFAAISDNPPSMTGNPYGGHVTMAQFIPKTATDNQSSKNSSARQKACKASAFKDFRDCIVGGVVPGDIPGAVAIGLCVTAGE
jgi:hypothetical protein